jgi:Ser/Thr protein kinase RdoA (MazF antagonist)
MRSFKELTRRGRLVRLREFAQAALLKYGLQGSLRFIQYTENITYRVDTAVGDVSSGNHSPYTPNRYLLRIHAMREPEIIASELIWLAALNCEAGLPVPAPISTLDGKLLASVITPGIPNGRVVSMMRWLDGRRLRTIFQPKHIFALGKRVAQMHRFSASWQPPAGFTRPAWDWDSQLGGSMFRHPVDDVLRSIPQPYLQPFQIISQEAKKVMDELGKGPDAYGMIHADLYPENVLFKSDEAFPIDFEDCGYGYWMWDISVALCTWAWGRGWKGIRDAFQEGYSAVRTLPDRQWEMLDLFIATQFATMVLWSSALFMNDPRRAAEYVPWREDNGERLLGYFNR